MSTEIIVNDKKLGPKVTSAILWLALLTIGLIIGVLANVVSYTMIQGLKKENVALRDALETEKKITQEWTNIATSVVEAIPKEEQTADLRSRIQNVLKLKDLSEDTPNKKRRHIDKQ
jgi:predicted small secreted protein